VDIDVRNAEIFDARKYITILCIGDIPRSTAAPESFESATAGA